MTEQDKKFYKDRTNLFETDGWRALVNELEENSKNVDKIDSINNEKDLWFARGQLSILRQIVYLEDTTRQAMTELDI